MPYADLSILEEKAKKAVKKLDSILKSPGFCAGARVKIEILKAGYEIDKTLIQDEVNTRCDCIRTDYIKALLA
jgi:hypothetical protein